MTDETIRMLIIIVILIIFCECRYRRSVSNFSVPRNLISSKTASMDNFFVAGTNGDIHLKDLSGIVQRLDSIETRIKPNGKFQFHDKEYSGNEVKSRLEDFNSQKSAINTKLGYAQTYNNEKHKYIKVNDTIYIYNFDKRKYLNHDAKGGGGGEIFTGGGKWAHEKLRIER